jgi:hypothetical protein
MFMIRRKVLHYIITFDRTDNDVKILYLKQKLKFVCWKTLEAARYATLQNNVFKVAAVSQKAICIHKFEQI